MASQLAESYLKAAPRERGWATVWRGQEAAEGGGTAHSECALLDKAPEPKRFVLVDGGSHHSTIGLGIDAYREAMGSLFGLRQRVAVR